MEPTYQAAARIVPTAANDQDEAGAVHAGPIVIEIVICLQQDPAGMPSTPVERPPVPAVLTRREQEVMDLVAQRYSNREIADRLVLAQSTVKAHMKRILSKLGVTNRYEAIEAVGRPLILERNA
jgi:DNA-binding NarL/FixJ family response regulator